MSSDNTVAVFFFVELPIMITYHQENRILLCKVVVKIVRCK